MIMLACLILCLKSMHLKLSVVDNEIEYNRAKHYFEDMTLCAITNIDKTLHNTKPIQA